MVGGDLAAAALVAKAISPLTQSARLVRQQVVGKCIRARKKGKSSADAQ